MKLAELEKTFDEFVDNQINFFNEVIEVMETKLVELKEMKQWTSMRQRLRYQVFYWSILCSSNMKEKQKTCLEQSEILLSKLD